MVKIKKLNNTNSNNYIEHNEAVHTRLGPNLLSFTTLGQQILQLSSKN